MSPDPETRAVFVAPSSTPPVAPPSGWRRWLASEPAAGALLFAVMVAALVLASSGLADGYRSFVDLPIAGKPLWYWVNDALMVLFFFVIGLELKRELVLGELRDVRKAALPMLAAAGGALVPALLYVALNDDPAGGRGWAVPMATDIAFVVGALALFGSKVPRALRLFVLTLAIADDLFAVVVIALFFTAELSLAWLAAAFGAVAGVVSMRAMGLRAIAWYVVAGVVLWWCTWQSGVHPTVAGVALGLLTPARDPGAQPGAETTLERLEHALAPWVRYAILPLFVFVNAGVALDGVALGGGIGLAVAVGLVVGKPLGIGLASWLSIQTGVARLPDGVSPAMLGAAGILCGIGFTMALFIATLGLDAGSLDAAKAGILTGSAAALVLGLAALALALRRR